MTEESSDVPKELLESVKDVIGRKIKISVKKKVKLEVKSDKVDNKILVLTSCRAFLLTSRIPTKKLSPPLQRSENTDRVAEAVGKMEAVGKWSPKRSQPYCI